MRSLLLSASLAILLGPLARGAEPDAKEIEFFESKIRPVLVTHCYSCHSAEAEKAKKLKGGLLLDSRDGLRRGGDSGEPAVVPGKVASSPLIAALRYEDLRMPPKSQLPDDVIAHFVKWVEMGAPDPRVGQTPIAKKGIDIDEGAQFWAFQPPKKVVPPQVKDMAWPRNDIDRFTRAAMEAKSVQPVADAASLVLLRRLCFDLIGLPPMPEEIDLFQKEYAAKPQGAVEALVDRLLASPHYGERWGRHWLDVARYAETRGSPKGNTPWPEAWRYRDYVIRSFNADKPYDRFVREQIAGDLLGGSTPQERDEGRLATGFLAIGTKAGTPYDQLEEQVGAIGTAFLGLTINCARCHDHKFDPIPQADYYAFAGILRASPLDEGKRGKANGPANTLETVPGAGPLLATEKIPPRPNLAVHIGGDEKNLGPVVERGLFQVLAPGKQPVIGAKESGRKQVAEWLGNADHPLTARVLVNRLWHHLFGRGLVPTVDNFGALGERPSHPELLDHLAVRFVEEGWSVKKMIRAIVLSRTYQLAYRAEPGNEKIDPDNVLLWRHAVRRLDAESIRDALLAAGGNLERKPLEGSLIAQVKFGPKGKLDAVPGTAHRSVYLPVLRGNPDAILDAFDFPDPSLPTGRRDAATVSTHGLFFMNHPFVMDQAAALAHRVSEAKSEPPQRLELAYRIVYGRGPSNDEAARAQEFLARFAATADGGDHDKTAWKMLCHALLASAEFRFVQ